MLLFDVASEMLRPLVVADGKGLPIMPLRESEVVGGTEEVDMPSPPRDVGRGGVVIIFRR